MTEGLEVTIRHETPHDIPAIHGLTAAAFGRESEPAVTDDLRASGKLLLSLVAEFKGAVVGHVAISPAEIDCDNGVLSVVALGPIAVTPAHQRQGIGGALVRGAIAECAQLGHPLVFLLGHTTYYPRHGFNPAKARGVRWSGDASNGPCEAFMVHEATQGALARMLRGRTGVFRFAPEFGE